MVHDVERYSVRFIGKGGAAVLQDDHAKVRVGGMPDGGLDDEFGGDTHHDYGVDIAASEHALERSSEKRVHARLADDGFIADRFDLIGDLEQLGHVDAGGGQHRDADLLEKFIARRKKRRLIIDHDMDDQDAGLARRIEHRLGRRADAALAIHGAASHGGFLDVHGKHGGPGAVEI